MQKNKALAFVIAALAFTGSATIVLGQTQNAGMGAGQPFRPAASTPRPMGAFRGNPVADYRRGVAALKARKYRDAIASFERALFMAPADSNTWTMLGLAREGAGDRSGARDAYAKAVGHNGGNIAARQRLGVLAAGLGQPNQAQAQLDALRKQAGECGAGCPNAAKLKSAIAVVEDALAHTPTPPPPPPG